VNVEAVERLIADALAVFLNNSEASTAFAF